MQTEFTFSMVFTRYNNYSVLEGFLFLILDSVLMLLIGLYLDNVFPKVGGTRHPWYYFLTANYWCPSKRNHVQDVESDLEEAKEGTEFMLDHGNENEQFFEAVSLDLKAQKALGNCFHIKNMEKKYDDGKVAVKNVTLDMYNNQVFVLLGHNGAGKTTALSMLTGLLTPTSGQAFIHGIDMFEENSMLKEMLGICPQESILYEELTIDEHFSIFCPFKGLQYSDQREELHQFMNQLAFYESHNMAVKNLSGGQKRKLSFLLSLIGNPKIIILDEPTSGLDVDARRKIWELIRTKKQDKIVLMTTHYMDEAEELGDRIAIMTDGEVKCCGSSLFLKKCFRTGYTLTMVKAENFNEEISRKLIISHAPSSQVKLNTPSEINFNVPFDYGKNFPQMFEEIDKNLSKLGISSYGMTITSLEDVFLIQRIKSLLKFK